MPKKSPSTVRNHSYPVRLSNIELEMLRNRALEAGIKASELVRRNALMRPLPKRVSKVDLKTYIELGRIGNNLNQLTKGVNTALKYGVTPPADKGELQELLELLHSIRLKIAGVDDDEEEYDEELNDREAD